MEPLYSIHVTCWQCENVFQSSRVRPSFKKAIRTDSDFCGYYKEENPDYYVVRVCPACGFASTEHSSSKLTEVQKRKFRSEVGDRWTPKDYSGQRDWNAALETYKLALLCAQAIEEKERIIASLLQHIAWMYRYKGNKEQEQRFMRFSLEAYVRVYETEVVGKNDARLLYLIGELNLRTGSLHEAAKWFSRVIHDHKIVDTAMIRASREQWAVLRELMTEKKLELPEEMRNESKSS
nr:DUF2225 domain-containing protein [Paenibacillus sediminis]